jgi:superfamily I DNA and/or RNA helicase
VVIVEEAAEVLEAHILTSLAPTVEHLVLIGDHFQLPPKVEVYELQKESGRGFNLNMSMFERLVEAGGVQHVRLQQQRRMRPDISQCVARGMVMAWTGS